MQELICITCPKGCVTKVWKEKGDIKIEGKICKKGTEYIKQEYTEPKRMLTSTVVVERSEVKRLPVRTREAIPKEKLLPAEDASILCDGYKFLRRLENKLRLLSRFSGADSVVGEFGAGDCRFAIELAGPPAVAGANVG